MKDKDHEIGDTLFADLYDDESLVMIAIFCEVEYLSGRWGMGKGKNFEPHHDDFEEDVIW